MPGIAPACHLYSYTLDTFRSIATSWNSIMNILSQSEIRRILILNNYVTCIWSMYAVYIFYTLHSLNLQISCWKEDIEWKLKAEIPANDFGIKEFWWVLCDFVLLFLIPIGEKMNKMIKYGSEKIWYSVHSAFYESIVEPSNFWRKYGTTICTSFHVSNSFDHSINRKYY